VAKPKNTEEKSVNRGFKVGAVIKNAVQSIQGVFAKITDGAPVKRGRKSGMTYGARNITNDRHKTIDLLQQLHDTQDKYKCVEMIVEKTPDGAQALNVFLRLANQGVDIELFNARTGAPVKKYDTEVREYCAAIGKTNAAGLDAFLDQLHTSALTRSGMACEVVVAEDAQSIEDVVIVDPAYFQFEYLEAERRYAIYQTDTQASKRVDLYDGNFFFVPYQPKVGMPNGTLAFESAIVTVEQYYKLIDDSLTVLNRIGYPRYNHMIDRKSLLESALPEDTATSAKAEEFLSRTFDAIESQMRSIGKDSDIISYDCVKTEILGGQNGSGIDLRSWFEALEPLIANSFHLTSVLLNRLDSGSYSLGTVEFKIVTETVDSMRRASKRILEQILNMWARVNGYNVYCRVSHKPIDWTTELEKLNAEVKKMEKFRRAEEYRWISHDRAAQETMGVEKADKPDAGFFEYLKKSAVAPTTDTSTSNASSDDDEDDDTTNNVSPFRPVASAKKNSIVSRFRKR
jgi:hypothetical protein